MFFQKKPTRLIISETNTSMYCYHLRLTQPGHEKYSGGAGKALCGREVGWDTKLPISSYGIKDHIPSNWCLWCWDKAIKEKLPGSEDLHDYT